MSTEEIREHLKNCIESLQAASKFHDFPSKTALRLQLLAANFMSYRVHGALTTQRWQMFASAAKRRRAD